MTFLNYIEDPAQKMAAVKRALVVARNTLQITNQANDNIRYVRERIAKHEVEVHRKYVLSIACLVFLLIGAPLGALIRIGGFGLPTIFAILIFILFFVLSIIGEKSAEKLVLSAFTGMWLPIFVIFPFGIILTRMAMRDSSFMNLDWYRIIKRKIAARAARKRKTVEFN
jgi:lipopolysaccharide export system permease protein